MYAYIYIYNIKNISAYFLFPIITKNINESTNGVIHFQRLWMSVFFQKIHSLYYSVHASTLLNACDRVWEYWGCASACACDYVGLWYLFSF